MCDHSAVEITPAKINEWIRIDRQRRTRAKRREQFFGRVLCRVRRTFVFLFMATVAVTAFNHYTEIETLAITKLGPAIKKIAASDRLRQNANTYENQVDGVSK
jgi:hypothetical protein